MVDFLAPGIKATAHTITSFNVRGEPIVCTPQDAFRCFMGTGIETLAVGNCYLRKENQDPALKMNYAEHFELD